MNTRPNTKARRINDHHNEHTARPSTKTIILDGHHGKQRAMKFRLAKKPYK